LISQAIILSSLLIPLERGREVSLGFLKTSMISKERRVSSRWGEGNLLEM
jgi:hypothetical protein